MPGRLDVVLHVSHEKRLGGNELILRENLMDFGALVPDAEIGPLKEIAEPVLCRLSDEMIEMNRAENKQSQTLLPAKHQKFPGVRQLSHGILHLFEAAMKPTFQLADRDVRRVPLVKICEGQAKLRAKFLERQFGDAR